MPPVRPPLGPPLSVFVLAFVFGGIGGALLDQLHVRFGVLSYDAPALLGQAWWVAPQFGLAAVLLLAAALPFARRAERQLPEPTFGTFAGQGAWLTGAYLASALLDAHGTLLLTFLAGTWLLRMTFCPARLEIAIFSVVLGAAGTAYECALSSTGVYWFHRPGFLTVPVWLPGLYMHGAPLAVWLGRHLIAPPRGAPQT